MLQSMMLLFNIVFSLPLQAADINATSTNATSINATSGNNTPIPESFVKAAIIYRLDTYVYWPPALDNQNLTIAILGKSEIFSILSHLKEMDDKAYKPIEVIQLDDIQSLKEAHILYISKDVSADVMKSVSDKPVIVIGDGYDCWKRNYHICMVKEGIKFRLTVDPVSFQMSGLDLDPELMTLVQL
jgi:hypothetical protein